uniref:Uncharacterized protein n=1 Tax=Ganoderma boninense TaxID=34458 RepID=A0A5K1JXI5_9APHY|nr:Uncharacterized protein [Ganoderma boninense]
MDPQVEDQQQQEIIVLKSIYEHDFIDVPPPKAWKAAPRLPEFKIRVTYPDPDYSEKIYFHLHTNRPASSYFHEK